MLPFHLQQPQATRGTSVASISAYLWSYLSTSTIHSSIHPIADTSHLLPRSRTALHQTSHCSSHDTSAHAATYHDSKLPLTPLRARSNNTGSIKVQHSPCYHLSSRALLDLAPCRPALSIPPPPPSSDPASPPTLSHGACGGSVLVTTLLKSTQCITE